MLGPSLSQGQVFRKQQRSRILNNNDVVTGNAARNKNKQSRTKNSKLNSTTIEPFSQNSDNGNKNYKSFSVKDIANNDLKIKNINDIEKAKTQASVSSYSIISNDLNKFQQGVTDEAKSYNTINKNSGLLNTNYLTEDNQFIRVNNKGVINTLYPSSLQQNSSVTPGLNISSAKANPPPAVNYIPVENIPPGATSGYNTGLYNQDLSSKQINLPKGISGYNLEGENVYVVYPYPNGPADINKNMRFIGTFTSDGIIGLSPDTIIPIETTLNCLQRAVDQGYSWCGMTNYSYSDNSQGGGGRCLSGNVTNVSTYAYNLQSIPTSNFGLNFPSGYSILTFGADGVLYAGYAGSNQFISPLTNAFSSELDPIYGGTINNLIASYAYNQGKWKNLQSFIGNSDPTGQPSGTFNTLYQYDVEIPNIGYYTQTYDSWWGEYSYQVPYIYYTTQTQQELAAPDVPQGNLTYINYKCGKNLIPPINIANQSGGGGYNVDCSELYNKYPSFTLTLSENGILTIKNNSAAISSADVNINMSYGYPKQITLTNGKPVTMNMQRPDWVSGSINQGNALTSSSKNTPSISNGQWISSPLGFCRLILNGGVLQLEYSLQDSSQDKDGNLVGTGSSIALYTIENINSSNLGTSAHIDINGAINPYPTGMIGYDNTYTEMKGYIPNPAILNQSGGNYIVNANDSQCKIACDNDPSCAGYVMYGNCNLLTSTNIFPNSARIPIPNYSTYIKNPKFPNNDNSCRDTLDAVVDADAYSYYLNNGITTNPPTMMTPNTKCNLGKVLDNQLNQLKEKNNVAVQKGEQIKNQFNDLFNKENNIINNILNNRTTSQDYNDYTAKIMNKIKDIENAQITKLAAQKDSELLLISDNYKYVIMGIVGLLISISTIKGLRMASS